jgi:RNA polymerase sigma factor (sigma-70 family)
MPSLQHVEISADVIERARRGDREAHERIYLVLSKPVYTLIRRLVIRPALAQDLLQDVFVEVLRSVASYRGSGSFLGWVKSIAVNKALMYLRSPWHRSLTWLGSDGAASLQWEVSGPSAGPMDEDLERALLTLPAVTRAVVWLHDVEGLTHAEIAAYFRRTPSFSKSQLARAHLQLRERLESHSGGLSCTPSSKNC